MHDDVVSQLTESRAVNARIEAELTGVIVTTAGLIAAALGVGRKLLVMGNGGSAADAQHFAAEIVGRFRAERPAWPAVALTTDTSILTAVGNDYGFEAVYARQVQALAQVGDVVVGLSTSGNSLNVLKALQVAKERGCITIALLGKDGGGIAGQVDHALIVPSADTPRIQEGHILIIHILCDLVERLLTGQLQPARGELP